MISDIKRKYFGRLAKQPIAEGDDDSKKVTVFTRLHNCCTPNFLAKAHNTLLQRLGLSTSSRSYRIPISSCEECGGEASLVTGATILESHSPGCSRRVHCDHQNSSTGCECERRPQHGGLHACGCSSCDMWGHND